MKRFNSIILSLVLIYSLCIYPIYALDNTVDELITIENMSSEIIISDALSNYLKNVDKDELVPVTIELYDDIDLQQVEKLAIEKANLTTSEMNILNEETSTLCDSENEAHQIKAAEIQNRITVERNLILKDHFETKNGKFIASSGISKSQIGSVGIFTPFIRNVFLTPAHIFELAKNQNVRYIDYIGDDSGEDFDTINNTYKIIRGNVFADNGYTGSGIRVGLVESGHPILNQMGSYSSNITKTDSNGDTVHATRTSGIIKKMAPSCSIYSRSANGLSDAIADCSTLISSYAVNVINISYGSASSGVYNSYSREMDMLIKNTGVPIVVASGNVQNNGSQSTQYVNHLGLGANVITVGGVTSSGTNQAASGAYSFPTYTLYREANNTINKPDICAPGSVSIFSYGEDSGTSYAAPHVTGTIVQMMARNTGLKGKSQILKAALMASASYNAGTSMSYVTGTRASNQEGAGVVDAGFCYKVARNGRRNHFDATASSTTFSYDVYCDYTTIPFRIACAWDVISSASATNITDYDMRVYKNGTLVASSVAYANSTTTARSNYEIIQLSPSILAQHGAGYYTVTINRVGSFYGSGTVRIGLAWEQR